MFRPDCVVKFADMPRNITIVHFQNLKVKVPLKLLISPSKFSGTRKFTLRYQKFEISGLEM